MNSFAYTVGAYAAFAVLSTKNAVLSAASRTRTACADVAAGYQDEACRDIKRNNETIELHAVDA